MTIPEEESKQFEKYENPINVTEESVDRQTALPEPANDVMNQALLRTNNKKKYKHRGGVKYIKNDVYLIDYQVKGGGRRQERICAVSLSEARAERNKRKVALREQVKRPSNENDRLNATFDEAWEKLEADLSTDGISLKCRQRYKRVNYLLFTEFRPTQFPDLKGPGQLKGRFVIGYKTYFVDVLKRNPNGGWKSELICIKAMMRRLKRLGFCTKEFIEELDEIKRPNADKKAYPDIANEELRKMFAFILKDRAAYYYPFMFMAITGRRITETISIKKGDIKWEGLAPARINIRPETTKTKHRETPLTRMNDKLKQIIIQGSRRNPSSEFLFSGSESPKAKPDRLTEYLGRISTNMLGVRITSHYFRHRFMTECGKARVPFADVSDISGIKDIKVMQKHYAHATASGHASVFVATAI